MSIFTLSEIDNQLMAWKTALAVVAGGQEYTILGRRLSRVDAGEIRRTIDWLAAEKSKLINADKPGQGRVIVGVVRR